ncbi:glycosyltransferase 87 family protein [Kitasatospora phosalacinea]|uniref:glycosyltransferase 87 family protein n=1 Tax=Kitasatospora phosalacinea TaxID=2065 RepID=UPI00069099D2|nr:glycosyltransferase 87 family protein [Kitasatospora phosalacinea]
MTTVQTERGTLPGGPARPTAPAWQRALTAPVRQCAAVTAALRAAPRRPLLAAAGIALLSLLGYAVVRHLAGTSMVDMVVYRAEGAAVADGHDLYALRVTEWSLPATYPPFAAMLFVPTTWFGLPFLRVAITAGNLLLLATLAHLSFKLVDWPRRDLRPVGVLLVTGLGVWLEPVFTTLRYGQINLALACLILWDLTRPDSARGKGLAIGIAAGIKLTPGLFAVYLLITGRVRAAFTAGATFVGTFLIGALVLPDATRGYWTKYMFDSSRVGKTVIVDNQSLRGLVARLLHVETPGAVATLLAALVAAAGLTIAVWAHRSARWSPRADAWSVCTALVTAVLVSPISWTHHWVWCVPVLVLLAAEAAHERSRPAAVRRLRWRPIFGLTLLGFLSFAMWIVPHKGDLDLHLSAFEQFPAGVYPLMGLCFLAVAALRVRSRRLAAGAPLVRVPAPRTDSDGLGSSGAQKAPAAR